MKKIFAVALVIAALGFSSGAKAGDEAHKHGNMDHSKMSHTGKQMDDAMFLDKFSQHHKGAIKMSEMAVTKAQNPELKKMAEKAIKDQTKEIEQMAQWRKEQYASVPTTNATVPQMDMTPLEKAEGAEFDRQFASMMVKHHEDGIAMANAAAPKIENKQVKKFARTAARNQTKEKQHLAKLAKNAAAASGSTKAE